MTPLKKGVVIVLAGAAILATLAGAVVLRRALVDAARADLEKRGLPRIDIVGVRIPCHGMFDIGVAAVFRQLESAEPVAGRLCRAPDSSSEWKWYTSPSEMRSAGK